MLLLAISLALVVAVASSGYVGEWTVLKERESFSLKGLRGQSLTRSDNGLEIVYGGLDESGTCIDPYESNIVFDTSDHSWKRANPSFLYPPPLGIILIRR
jgi:hypothetical protein